MAIARQAEIGLRVAAAGMAFFEGGGAVIDGDAGVTRPGALASRDGAG